MAGNNFHGQYDHFGIIKSDSPGNWISKCLMASENCLEFILCRQVVVGKGFYMVKK